MAVNSPTAMKSRRGHFFDLTKPDAADVFIEDIVHSLAQTCRFSGHPRNFFSVAQHSVECAEVSIQRTGRDDPEWKDKAYACLMHDSPEAFYGDIASPMKIALGLPFRDFAKPIDDAVLTAVKAKELLDKYHDHVKQIDNEMLYSDAVRWGMDGILVDGGGSEIIVPRDWVPQDFEPHFPDAEPLAPVSASWEFWRMFLALDGLARGVQHYSDIGEV